MAWPKKSMGPSMPMGPSPNDTANSMAGMAMDHHPQAIALKNLLKTHFTRLLKSTRPTRGMMGGKMGMPYLRGSFGRAATPSVQRVDTPNAPKVEG